MKFGSTTNPSTADLALPEDHPGNQHQLEISGDKTPPLIHIGCAKWNRQELQNFYPRGTKDELGYYSRQFNSIELNATFYRIFPSTVFSGWKDKTPNDFVFYPKVPQVISHRKRLNDVQHYVDEFVANASHLDEKLGMAFLQMMENFSPTNQLNRQRLADFIEKWPRQLPLAIELRHSDWYNNERVSDELNSLFEAYGVIHVITDTAGRRDLLHMRLSTPYAFIRFVGANHESDYQRLDDWVDRLEKWTALGIRRIGFFVHQNHEVSSPLLGRYFIEQLNQRIGANLRLPETQTQTAGTPTATSQQTLF